MHVTIVGLGLIGGSIARSLRAAPATADWLVDGWSRRPETCRQALDSGAVDRIVSLEDAVSDVELLVLAVPPLACLEFLDELGGPLRPRLDSAATITDVASTKAAIVGRADAHMLRFVGGHPMAGRETSGFGSSLPDLFAGRPWVVVPGRAADDRDVERVTALALAVGARPRQMDATVHDDAVAAISHLPLVLSTALVEAVCGRPGEPSPAAWSVGRDLAAGGWRDMTRIAKGDPAMAAGIAATNAPPIVDDLRRVREILDEWIALIDRRGGPDATDLERRFAEAAGRLEHPEAVAGGSTRLAETAR